MNIRKTVHFIRKNFILYLIGTLLILGMKYFYSRAGSEELRWILAPTTRWVEILSGIPFACERGVGYVNHDFRFLIAPSCSGVQFLLITAATLIFSFVHRIDGVLYAGSARRDSGTASNGKESEPREMRGGNPRHGGRANLLRMTTGLCWIGASLLLSYLLTIFVNGLRIIAAIYVPDYLDALGIHSDFFNPDRLHTMIGVVVYFASLLTIYQSVEFFFQKADAAQPNQAQVWGQLARRVAPPIFWYLFIALGIPFLNRAYQKRAGEYLEFASLITLCCSGILSLSCLLVGIKELLKRIL